MNIDLFYEILGYAASVIVAVSLMMSSIVKLRWYNLIGAVGFSTYGFLIGSIPVGVLNGFIALADIYYLVLIYRNTDALELIEVCNEKKYYDRFIDFYQDDIKKFFPNFDKKEKLEGFYVLKNLVPAALFLGKTVNGDTFEIKIDYAVPAYRDFSMGEFIFKKEQDFFKRHKYTKAVSGSNNKAHDKYLEKMGFEIKNGRYEIDL